MRRKLAIAAAFALVASPAAPAFAKAASGKKEDDAVTSLLVVVVKVVTGYDMSAKKADLPLRHASGWSAQPPAEPLRIKDGQATNGGGGKSPLADRTKCSSSNRSACRS